MIRRRWNSLSLLGQGVMVILVFAVEVGCLCIAGYSSLAPSVRIVCGVVAVPLIVLSYKLSQSWAVHIGKERSGR